MQWGDLSFQGDNIGDYVSGKAKQYLNLKKVGIKLWETKRSTGMDGRLAKIRTLAQIYAREKTP